MTELSANPLLRDGPPRARTTPGRYNPVQRGGERAYRAARRHSTLVRSLRFVLPALAVAGLAIFLLTARFIPSDVRSLLNVSGVDIGSRSVIMDKPRLSGFDGTERAYDVTADTATQSLDDPKIIALSGITGHFGLGDAGTATVKATSGIYNGHTSDLALSNGIDAVTTQGYTARLIDAAVNVDSGKLMTDKPVVLTLTDETIRANAMTVLDRGKHVLFTGGVSVIYQPPDNQAAPNP